MKENFWFFFGLLIVMGLVNFFPEIAKALLKEKTFITLTNFIAFVLGLILQLGFIKICLKFSDQQKPKFSEFFLQYPLFFKMFFGYILYFLIVLVGLILFIIPGIVFAIKFSFYKYFIVDEGLGPIEALKRSYKITRGATWNLFLFFSLTSAINLIGVFALLIGLFATIPTTTMATAFVYRKLLIQSETA